MSKRIYISADYDLYTGDREVIDVLMKWNKSHKYVVDFVDMASVTTGSVSSDPDCRPCDLKLEFNRQINASSVALFVVGNNTATRTAGAACPRTSSQCLLNKCTPYKQNRFGAKFCRVTNATLYSKVGDVNCINDYSYLRHEFEQAKKKNKQIIVVYNSFNKQPSWLPSYLKGYENQAIPFWTCDILGNKVGNYIAIKSALGYA
jgi:hypothetical protein